ncbi:MAG TPA: hypothetical protein RWO09_09530, partial [Ruminococcus sp.]
MIKTKSNAATINPLVKIASHMFSMGYYAVSQRNYVKISYNISEYENYSLTLYDSNANIDTHYTVTPVILTDNSEPNRYIIEKDGILYISKYLGEECICELLKYHLKRNDKDTQIRKHTTGILLELGVPANLNGYEYLKISIELAIKNGNLLRQHRTKHA